jgi:peptide/nickel transport system permease protein
MIRYLYNQYKFHGKRLFALATLTIIVFVVACAPILAPYDPIRAVTGEELKPPTQQHLFGTDWAGRDVLSRILYGGQLTLTVALVSMLLSMLPGICLGLVAGYFGGLFDTLISAVIDALLAFPSLVLALALMTIFESSAITISFTLGLAGIPLVARITRSAVVVVKHRPYVEASRALGAPVYRIIGYHILPNISSTLLSYAAVMLSWAILNTATLHFLGFGGDPSVPEWGSMLAESRTTFRVAPMPAIAPSIAIMLTLLCINLLVDSFVGTTTSTD